MKKILDSVLLGHQLFNVRFILFGLATIGSLVVVTIFARPIIQPDKDYDNKTTAVMPSGPGGVSGDLQVWLRSDAGVTESAGTVTTWTDQSSNSFVTAQDGSTRVPLYETTNPDFNFNPSLDFISNQTTRLVANNTGDIIGDNGLDNYTIFFVASPEGGSQAFFSLQADVNNQHYGAFATNAGRRAGRALYNSGNNVPVSGRAHLLGAKNNTNDVTNTANLFGYQNGVAFNSGRRSTNVGNISRGQLRIGGGDGFTYKGHLAEVVIFDAEKSSTEIQQIRAYLATKYGITLTEDYLSSTGITTWTSGGGYDNAITGIGRDDASGLNQKQSRSQEPQGIVTLGLGTIAATNQGNPNNIAADGQFLLFGDDGATMAWTSTGAPSSGGGVEVLGRKFLVQETGSVGNVSVSVSDNSSGQPGKLPDEGSFSVVLLIDDDGDFTTGSTEVTMTLNGSEWVSDRTIDFNSGQFFTFARKFAIDASVTATPVSCTNAVSNEDAALTVTGPDNVINRIGFSLGTTYSGPAFVDATVASNPAAGFTVTSSLENPDFTIYYTVRVFFSETIFEDYVVSLDRKACSVADLALSITPDTESANEGENLSYTVTLTNNGPDPAVNVAVRVDLPTDLSLLTASSALGAYSPGSQLWTIDLVPVGSHNLSLTYRMR